MGTILSAEAILASLADFIQGGILEIGWKRIFCRFFMEIFHVACRCVS